jgi:hypothetical protein
VERKSKRWVSANLLIARICEFCERLFQVKGGKTGED